MAVANVLAAGTTAATSTDIAVTATPVTVSLFTAAGTDVPSGFSCVITKLNSSATHSPTGYVLSAQANSVTGETQLTRTLTSPGTYRVVRPLLPAGYTAVGVDMDT